jgi:hypothetical protein
MNENRLAELASRIKALLAEFEIDTESFQLKIGVPEAYYNSIKDNFSVRHPVDVIVGTQGDDWWIEIVYFRPMIIPNQGM